MSAEFGGLAEDPFGLFDGEVAYGVEDPVEGEAEFAFGAFAGAFEGGEDGLEAARIEVAPHVDDTDGNVDLGVDDALRGELLHHAPGGDLVIFGVLSRRVTALKAFDELGEVGEAVDGFGLGKR